MSYAMTYWSISSQELCKEAEKLGFTIDILSKEKNTFYISDGKQEILFKSTDFGENSALGFKLCKDKGLTYSVLEKNNLPTAKSIYISKTNFLGIESVDVSCLKMPLIIKPLTEGHGNGVMMCISNIEELQRKLSQSFQIYQDMIIQEQIKGDEVRVIVVKGEVILAYKRIPASLIGDSIHTIQELASIENTTNPLRGTGYESPLVYIQIDDELISYIGKQGMTIDYIPDNKQEVQLRGNSNTGTGGTMQNVTDTLHISTKEICIEAASLLGLEISGVDIIAEDISQPLKKQGGIILEVNATPGIGGEKDLTGVNTAYEILKRVFN